MNQKAVGFVTKSYKKLGPSFCNLACLYLLFLSPGLQTACVSSHAFLLYVFDSDTNS